jgi:hypothetical protein
MLVDNRQLSLPLVVSKAEISRQAVLSQLTIAQYSVIWATELADVLADTLPSSVDASSVINAKPGLCNLIAPCDRPQPARRDDVPIHHWTSVHPSLFGVKETWGVSAPGWNAIKK